MRTQPAHIEPGCTYCNQDHNPDIQCREKPESVRFQLRESAPKPRRKVCAIRDGNGKLIAVKHV